eukprot:1149402-Pelagomonas_calceolata.AAC.1
MEMQNCPQQHAFKWSTQRFTQGHALSLLQAYLPEGLPEECENSVSFWLAVTDVPVEAGCLRFIPGSHLSDLRRHTPVRAQTQEEEAAQQAEADVPRALRALVGGGERAALVPIKRGDVVAHSDRVVHGSGPNLSSQWRCAAQACFPCFCIPAGRSLLSGPTYLLMAA